MDFIEPELLGEIHEFESFLKKIGFKRVEGSVLGLLVLAKRPLVSEEIEKTLSLSQSAVSQAIKNLSHFGAIETRETLGPKDRRIKTHTAKEDSLQIVGTVFRKREQEAIEEFKAMAERALSRVDADESFEEGRRSRRLKSIIATCEIAEAVMKFVIHLSQKHQSPYYDEVVKKLPRVFDLVIGGAEPLAGAANEIKSTLTNKLKDGITRLAEGALQK